MFYRVYVPHLCIHSAIGGPLGCLHLLATVSNASKIFGAQSICLENTCSVLLVKWFAVPSLCLLKVFRGRVAFFPFGVSASQLPLHFLICKNNETCSLPGL